MVSRLLILHQPERTTARGMAYLTRQLKRGYDLPGRPFTAGRLHSSFHHLGDYADLPPRLVGKAIEAAASVAMAPFEVTFDRVATFKGRKGDRPLVLRGGDALVALQAAIGDAMAAVGLKAFVNANFTPHITLLRGDGIVEEQMVRAFDWTVREFILVNSLVGQGKYVELGRWSLAA